MKVMDTYSGSGNLHLEKLRKLAESMYKTKFDNIDTAVNLFHADTIVPYTDTDTLKENVCVCDGYHSHIDEDLENLYKIMSDSLYDRFKDKITSYGNILVLPKYVSCSVSGIGGSNVRIKFHTKVASMDPVEYTISSEDLFDPFQENAVFGWIAGLVERAMEDFESRSLKLREVQFIYQGPIYTEYGTCGNFNYYYGVSSRNATEAKKNGYNAVYGCFVDIRELKGSRVLDVSGLRGDLVELVRNSRGISSKPIEENGNKVENSICVVNLDNNAIETVPAQGKSILSSLRSGKRSVAEYGFTKQISFRKYGSSVDFLYKPVEDALVLREGYVEMKEFSKIYAKCYTLNLEISGDYVIVRCRALNQNVSRGIGVRENLVWNCDTTISDIEDGFIADKRLSKIRKSLKYLVENRYDCGRLAIHYFGDSSEVILGYRKYTQEVFGNGISSGGEVSLICY